MNQWIWQQKDWPHFSWEQARIDPLLRDVRMQQGIVIGRMGSLDDDIIRETALDTLLQNIMTSSAIEGEVLNIASVRSSLAKRLGFKSVVPTSSRSEGLAKMMLDALNHSNQSLTIERLFQWHHWLFPDTEQNVLHAVQVGVLPGDEPMQVVSGRIDKPTVHFEAPPRAILEKELANFIRWFNKSLKNAALDPLLRAAICHLWFVTLHPFDDGNGRITRVLTDLALAEADKQSIRLYTMSAKILEKRREYYQILEQSQRGTLDITAWLVWFLETLKESLHAAIHTIDLVLQKTRFWQHHRLTDLSVEQRKVLNRLLDGGEKGFEAGISAAKYQKVAKVSKATATRHLSDLLAKGCLLKLPGGGRNTRYKIKAVKSF